MPLMTLFVVQRKNPKTQNIEYFDHFVSYWTTTINWYTVCQTREEAQYLIKKYKFDSDVYIKQYEFVEKE